ncbi:hypothetical protein GCM10010329_27580 [Streptomyces spiroverticillatus]|uniref:DUF397 domain-containing protein n=1 Tax=Streptomyces finlayi TaxID=67296 RepID=A0A919C8S7_9ACTN|nr:DUF397 domain-containing protein [Streptomyces finlayi]GHA03669.1 hypothetical protein GCM10010329_27580 [Streptomyces spiroverticillatus]GHC87804.1 hypothetical protein GCM10010334_19990 [Streptomyces finlayi]
MTTRPSADTTDGLMWLKSSYSSNEGPDCVEIADSTGAVRVRDSKNQQGPQLAFGRAEWSVFVSYAADRT